MPDATTEQFDTAQAAADTAWAERDSYREPMRDELHNIVDGLEGVTGLGAGPGAERLIDAFLDFAEMNADKFDAAATARQAALTAQENRDEIAAALPVEPPPPVPSLLDSGSESSVRSWLVSANDADVTDALLGVLDAGEQREWAYKLMKWGRADGNTAQVFAAINAFITPQTLAAPTESAQVPETASADDEPVTPQDARQTPPIEGTTDEVVAWIGDDTDRALIAIDTEMQQSEPRTDLVDAAREVVAATLAPTPEEPATPEVTENPSGDPAPAEGDNG